MLRNSRCVNKYPKKVLKCISKLDKKLQYAVIDGLEKGGDDLVRAVKNLDDDAAESFIKTASKQDDEFLVLMSKYDNIPSWACSDVIDFNSAENVNEILKQNGYTNPPYKPGTNVTTIEWFCQYHLTHFIRTRIMQRERYDHSRAFFGLPEAAHRWRCRFFC